MSVEMGAVVDRTLPPSGGEITVEVTIDALAKTRPTTRHIALLLDTSGSMFGTKIDNAKEGATQALKELSDTDYVSIVGFDSEVEIVQPMTRWEHLNQQSVIDEIREINTGGGTDIYKGLETVKDQLVKDTPDQSRAVKRIILLSDGQDRYSPSTYRDLASEYADDGISIMAAGIGEGYDEAVMVALANASGGMPADLSEEDISHFLGSTVSDTEDVLAPNPHLQISPASGFIVTDEPAYFDAPKVERRPIDTDDLTIHLPELQVDKPHRFTFKMLSQPKSAGITHPLANLKLVDATGSDLATTSLDISFEDESRIKKATVEKTRATAKITTKIQDPDISKQEVISDIDKLEERGWTETADELQEKLDQSEEAGGIIRLSKSGISDAR